MTHPATHLSSTTIPSLPHLADVVTLTKPRITATVLATTLGGYFLGRQESDGLQLAATTLGTILVVGGANTLNMYIERNSDGHMKRTCHRPLPAGRMTAGFALGFGLGITFLALMILTFLVNPVAGIVAALANASYVLLYTPLKRYSSIAVWVGSVPGALAPLLGWAAATGNVKLAGWSLFAILFFWQIPHFHAIALFRQREYEQAGLKVLPLERGDVVTRRQIAFWSVVHLGVTLIPYQLGVASIGYLVTALLLGVPFTLLALQGLRSEVAPRWAHKVFGYSIPYLVILFAALIAARVA